METIGMVRPEGLEPPAYWYTGELFSSKSEAKRFLKSEKKLPLELEAELTGLSIKKVQVRRATSATRNCKNCARIWRTRSGEAKFTIWLANEERNQEAARGGVKNDWPKIAPIQSELPPVETFSEGLLPDSFRALVTDITERMQVPMDYPAVMMVLCLAGAVNRRAIIQPKANVSKRY